MEQNNLKSKDIITHAREILKKVKWRVIGLIIVLNMFLSSISKMIDSTKKFDFEFIALYVWFWSSGIFYAIGYYYIIKKIYFGHKIQFRDIFVKFKKKGFVIKYSIFIGLVSFIVYMYIEYRNFL